MANRTLVPAIFLLALLLRLGYLADVSESPYFGTLILDAEEYDHLAEELRRGNWRLDEKQTYVHGLGYPAFLAALKIPGFGPADFRLWQAVLGALSCVLIYRIARRLFDRRVAVIAGTVAAAYWPFLFFGGELFATTLFIFIQLLLVDALLRFGERPDHAKGVAAGVILGLLVATRANALLAIPVALWWICRCSRAASDGDRRRLWPSFAVALVLTLSPLALRNHIVQGGPVPFQGAWSFYMGANPQADGTPYVRQGLQWQRHELLPLRAGFFEPVSKGFYYLRSGVRFAAENPGQYLHLLYRKFRLFWHAFEIPVSSDLSYYREHSILYRILLVNFGVVAPLAVAGLFPGGGRRDDRYLLLWTFVLVSLATGMLFTVSARYRVPAAPFLIILAAHAIRQLTDLLRARDWRRTGGFVAVLAAAAAVVHTGVDYRQVDHVRPAFLMGMVHFRSGDLDAAEQAYENGLAKNPDDPDLLNGLGTVYSAQGRHGEAEDSFAKAIAVAEDYAQPRFNLGALYLRLGRRQEAIAALKQGMAIDLRPTPRFKGNLALGNAYMQEGQLREAARAFERALQYRRDPHAYYGLSNARGQLGDAGSQVRALEQAVELDSTFAPALRNLGVLYLMRGDPEAAEAALLQSIRHDSTSAVAHQNLAALYSRRGQTGRARAALDKAERLVERQASEP